MYRHLFMRDKLIDVAKGLGIFLVVLGHTHHGVCSHFVYLFHMPLFFFLSGATLVYSKSKAINVGKRAKSLLLPYLVFSLVSFGYWWLIESKFRPVHLASIFSGRLGELPMPMQQFLNIFTAICSGNTFLYNVALWFLPCFFISVLCYLYIRKLGGNIYSPICYVILAGIAFVVNSRYPSLFWNLNTAMIALPLIWMGEKFYTILRNASVKQTLIWCVLSIILAGSIIYIFDPSVNMMHHQFGAWWQFYIVSLSLIVVFLFCCKIFVSVNFIHWLGKNSIIIMCTHEPLKRLIIKVFSMAIGQDTEVIRQSLPISIAITLITILSIIPLVVLINRYIPFIIGHTRKTK